MRFVLVLLVLFLAGCGSPAQSDVARKLNGAWQADNGVRIVFDFDQDRVLIDDVDTGLKIDRVQGQTVYFKGVNNPHARLIGDNAAEWTTDIVAPTMLTRMP